MNVTNFAPLNPEAALLNCNINQFNNGRFGHAMVKTDTGKFRVCGGYNDNDFTYTDNCEIYDKNTNIWSLQNSDAMLARFEFPTAPVNGTTLWMGGKNTLTARRKK